MTLSDIKCRYHKIDGFEDYYITEEGDVYSERPIGASKEGKLHKLVPKNPGRDDKYYNICLCKDGKENTRQIHRLVAEYFCDGYFDGAVVNHIDGNRRNNRSDNLEWVTQRENIRKSYVTSGVDATRNYKWWVLLDRDGSTLGVFKGHAKMEKYVRDRNIDAMPSVLSKYCSSNGYRVIKIDKQASNCNDYPEMEYTLGEIPNVEAPSSCKG